MKIDGRVNIALQNWREKKTNKLPSRKWMCPNCGEVVSNGVKVKIHKEQCKQRS